MELEFSLVYPLAIWACILDVSLRHRSRRCITQILHARTEAKLNMLEGMGGPKKADAWTENARCLDRRRTNVWTEDAPMCGPKSPPILAPKSTRSECIEPRGRQAWVDRICVEPRGTPRTTSPSTGRSPTGGHVRSIFGPLGRSFGPISAPWCFFVKRRGEAGAAWLESPGRDSGRRRPLASPRGWTIQQAKLYANGNVARKVALNKTEQPNQLRAKPSSGLVFVGNDV